MECHDLIREHIKRIQDRYRDSNKQAKKTILNEFCHTGESVGSTPSDSWAARQGQPENALPKYDMAAYAGRMQE